MSNAADGYLGDWLPHKSNCKCTDCQLERAQQRIARLEQRNKTLREALEAVRVVLGEDSYFLIEKISGPMTNGDQGIIDDMLIKIDAALKETEAK